MIKEFLKKVFGVVSTSTDQQDDTRSEFDNDQSPLNAFPDAASHHFMPRRFPVPSEDRQRFGIVKPLSKTI